MGVSGTGSIVSPEDQSVTFVELFFDLVFVFSLTQVVGFLHHHMDWTGVGQSLLVFWLIWWAWTQFTWALNAADTTHPGVDLATLVATGVAFFMAVAVPEAVGEGALWFAIPYVLVRVIGLVIYSRVAWEADESQHAAVKTFALMSAGGLGAVIAGGIAGGETQLWLWGMAIVFDVIAALVAARHEGWNLHADHFGERHGLFIIIALGESLIVAAAGLTTVGVSTTVLAVGGLAVALTCALWWTHFTCAKPALDAELERREGAHRSMLARDAYSLLHFPLVLGVIGVAVAIEGIVAHPADPLDAANRIALGGGVALFTGTMALALWRSGAGANVRRLAVAIVTAGAVIAVSGVSPVVTLAIALAGVVLLAALEHRAHLPPATFDL